MCVTYWSIQAFHLASWIRKTLVGISISTGVWSLVNVIGSFLRNQNAELDSSMPIFLLFSCMCVYTTLRRHNFADFRTSRWSQGCSLAA